MTDDIYLKSTLIGATAKVVAPFYLLVLILTFIQFA